MSLRVVFLNRSFYPDITATGQLLTELCEDLVKDYNCQVTVIVGRPLILISKDNDQARNFGKGIVQKENLKGIEILRVKNTTFSPELFLGRVSNYLTYFLLSFIASFKLKKPDLVITLTDPPIIGLAGLFISRRFNIPLIISVNDIFPEVARGLEGSQNGAVIFLLDYIYRFCLKKANHIVALGKIMQRRIIEEKGVRENKVSIIPSWADSKNIFPVSKRNPFSLTHNLADYFVVMYAGNIGASSGLETLIDSAQLLKAHKDMLFALVGEGIKKEKLIQRTKDYNLENVRFFPYQPKEKLSDLFSSADIFIIPLKKGLVGYSLPSKIYTILASARPYIACMEEGGEVGQITQEFNCGLMARPEDPLDLSEKILFLYKDKELRARLGENARYAAGFFDRSEGVKKYYALFKEVNQ